jgi:hypothetical protein
VLKEIKGTSGSGKIFLFLIFYGKGKQEWSETMEVVGNSRACVH